MRRLLDVLGSNYDRCEWRNSSCETYEMKEKNLSHKVTFPERSPIAIWHGTERTMMIWVLGTWLRDSWSYSRCKGVEFELKQLIKRLDRNQTVETLCWQNWEIVLWSFSDHSPSSWMKSHVIKRAVDSCLAAGELQSMKINQLCRTIHLSLMVHKVFVLVRLYGRM